MKPDDPVLNIKFVKEIENNECLWNFVGPNPLKRQIQDKKWQEISKKFNEPVSSIRERWRNIRTAFYAAEKTSYTRGGARPKRSYYLSQHLQFLLGVKNNNNNNPIESLQSILQCGNIDNESTNQNSDVSENLEIIDVDTEDNIKYHHNHSIQQPSYSLDTDSKVISNFDNNESYQSTSSYMKSRPIKKKRHGSSSAVDVDVAIVDLAKSFQRNSNYQDSNELFLNSMLPDMRKLTDQQNRSFRIKVLTLLDELLIQNES